MMTLVLGANPHRLAVNPVEGPLPMLRAAVPANDPLLAAIAAHQGPLELVVGDGPSLVLPPSPTIREFIGECASGDVSPITADRKSVVEGKSVSVRVDLGGRRTIKKKKYKT